VEAIKRLLVNFRLGDLLYREYRSRSIHEFSFDVDDRFFREVDVYVASRLHDWDSTRFLELSVPARWLIGLYNKSVHEYRLALLRRRKLPIKLWVELCDPVKESQFLDDASIDVGRDLSIRVGR